MSDFFPVYIYLGIVVCITLLTMLISAIFPAVYDKVKYMPYESGIQTETHLLQKRVPIHHYLVALIFLVFDIEVIFLYPWAVIGKKIGSFAFYEMTFFLIAMFVGYAYVWRKGGLQWE